MDAAPGQSLSHYRLIEKLGAGGMGVVWLARDTVLDREVAVKILPADAAIDPRRREMFLKEARLASSISDAHIVEVHEFGREGDLDFIVMEYVEGQPLGNVMRGRALAPDRVAEIGAQIARALARAHRKSLLHRDLKPANVLVTPDGDAKVVDFGLAILVRGDETALGTAALTQSLAAAEPAGTIAGTVPYMSPEQVRGDRLDARSDIFSLGTILYEMTVGRRPFTGDSTQALMRDIEAAEPPPPHDVVPDLPMELDRIIRKALARKPDQRYQSAADLEVDLRRLGRDLETGSSLSYREVARPPGRRRFPATALATALVVVALIVAAVWWWWGVGPTSPPASTRITSLAVLPFDNLMDDGQDYFVEGMHEALITELAGLRGLRVISRTSTMRYEDIDKSIPEIAAELGVDAVVEGSVLRADGKVRITAQLIDGRTDEHVWADQYDRDSANTLELLNDVARSITDEIHVSLTPQQRALLGHPASVSSEAYDAFLRGQYHFNQGGADNFRVAREHFREAVTIESSFASAWASLAGCDLVLGFFGSEPSGETIPRARASARQALSLDERQARAHMVLGYIALFFDWDWNTAERELLRALELNPTDALIHHGYADYLGVMGDIEGSLRQVLEGRRYDPVGYWANQVVLGHLVMAGRYERAVEEGERMTELFPLVPGIRNYLALALWYLGRYDEAIDQYRTTWGADSEIAVTLEAGLAEGGPERAWQRWAERYAAGDPSRVDPLNAAQLFAFAGDVDTAFVWLERALEVRDPQLLHLPMDPRFASLRADARYRTLLERIGLPAD